MSSNRDGHIPFLRIGPRYASSSSARAATYPRTFQAQHTRCKQAPALANFVFKGETRPALGRDSQIFEPNHAQTTAICPGGLLFPQSENLLSAAGCKLFF